MQIKISLPFFLYPPAPLFHFRLGTPGNVAEPRKRKRLGKLDADDLGPRDDCARARRKQLRSIFFGTSRHSADSQVRSNRVPACSTTARRACPSAIHAPRVKANRAILRAQIFAGRAVLICLFAASARAATIFYPVSDSPSPESAVAIPSSHSSIGFEAFRFPTSRRDVELSIRDPTEPGTFGGRQDELTGRWVGG